MKLADSTLTGTQRAAVVLMQMSPANAAKVMAQFNDAEAEDIAAEIVRLRKVDPEVAEQIMKDFHEAAMSSPRQARGGRELAEGLLEASFGSEKAAGLLNRLTVNMAGKSFEFLEDIEPVQILALIDGELPQTIALVLAHLSPRKASAVMSGLPGSLRADVALSIATMGSGAPEAIGIVADTLKLAAARPSRSRHPRWWAASSRCWKSLTGPTPARNVPCWTAWTCWIRTSPWKSAPRWSLSTTSWNWNAGTCSWSSAAWTRPCWPWP